MRKISKIFMRLLNTVITYLSMLSIRSKKIYVFGAWEGNKFSDNSKSLYLQALRDNDILAVWITKNKNIYKTMNAHGFKVHMHNSFKGVYYQLRASVYFTCMRRCDVSEILMGNATRVNLWHGVGLKKFLFDDTINFLKNKSIQSKMKRIVNYLPYIRKEYTLSTSDQISEIFASAFRSKREKILQLGQPRNDIFFDDSLETEPLAFKKGTEKMILYMPTHRNFGKKKMLMKEVLDLKMLNEFCANHNIIFVIKKHYCHYNEFEELNGLNNIKDVTQIEYDSQQLLKHADILITDYSSCYVDFLLLDRPVIFYNYDYDDYVLNDRDLYFDYDTTTPGEKVKDFNGLYTALKRLVIDEVDQFQEGREQVKNIFYSRDNQKKVGEKILKYVKDNL